MNIRYQQSAGFILNQRLLLSVGEGMSAKSVCVADSVVGGTGMRMATVCVAASAVVGSAGMGEPGERERERSRSQAVCCVCQETSSLLSEWERTTGTHGIATAQFVVG